MPIGGSVQDELLRLGGSTNDPTQTLTATFNSAPAFFGPDVMFDFRLLVVGTVSGTNPTLDVKIQASADGVSSFTDVGIFSQITATQLGATGSLAEPPHAIVRVPALKPYLRAVFTVGGTTPSFGGVSLLHSPIASAVA